MTQNVAIYINNVKVATAVATAGSATLASVSDISGLYGPYAKSGSNTNDSLRGFQDWPELPNGTRTKPPSSPLWHGEVMIQSTSGANASGKSYRTRIVTDAGSTVLVMKDKHPFAD